MERTNKDPEHFLHSRQMWLLSNPKDTSQDFPHEEVRPVEEKANVSGSFISCHRNNFKENHIGELMLFSESQNQFRQEGTVADSPGVVKARNFAHVSRLF